MTANAPVLCTIGVTRIAYRRYVIRFATFREAVTRLNRMRQRWPAFHWHATQAA